MQRSGYVRWIISLIVCFSVFFYNFYGFLKPLYQNKIENIIPYPDGELIASEPTESKREETVQEEEKEEPEKESVSSKTESAESLPTSAKDVKGQILSKYISPYTAPTSYSKVYVKNSTGTQVDIKKLLEADLGFKIKENTSDPQVLILHTHATESFMESDSSYYTSAFSPRSRDNQKNMIKIGAIVAEKLNGAGIKTLHDTTLHDYPEYTGSYTRAAGTINWYLKKYPTIKVVLDLHRDSVSSGSTKTKLVTEIGGKKAAQVMLVMGSQTGIVTNHPKWQENLKLAFKVQQKLEEKYPTLARPLMLASKLYNQNLTTGSLLFEFGTDANSLSEVHYSAQLVGNVLIEVLKED